MCNPDKPWYITTEKWNYECNHLKGKSSDTGESCVTAFDYLYNRLSIIDGKVSSLFSANTILLAVAGFLAFKFPYSVSCDSASILVLKASAILWLVSTLLCLFVSFLKWEYLDSTASNKDKYIGKIMSVTVRRTHCYNIAVTLISLSILSFLYVAQKYFWV